MSAAPFRVVFLDAATLPQGLCFEPSHGVAYCAHAASAPGEVAQRIADAHIVITNKVRLTASHIQAAQNLQMIAVAAAGTDNVDLQAARERGIPVHNVPDYGSNSVAEHTIALLFALRRSLPDYLSAARDGRWAASTHFSFSGARIRDLHGSTFGVIGRGRIGEAVAQLARGLGMRLLFAESPEWARREDEYPLDTVLAQSDAITLHVPLTEQTRSMIGPRALQLMKRDAVLINTGRGALIDAQALADALRRGVIAGAAIDVLDVEPPPKDHALLAPDIPNLLLTPHVAWASDAAQARLAGRLCELVIEHSSRSRS